MFKVGDKVKIIGKSRYGKDGHIGQVSEITSVYQPEKDFEHPYNITFKDGTSELHSDKSLESLEPKSLNKLISWLRH